MVEKISKEKIFACREATAGREVYDSELFGVAVIVSGAGYFISEKLLKEFLPVFDNFTTAFAHQEKLSEDSNWQNWAKGIEYIKKQFEDILTQSGVEIIKTVGEDFDPTYHEAVSEEESKEIESGKIIKEVGVGYKVGEKILKVAKVVVAK